MPDTRKVIPAVLILLACTIGLWPPGSPIPRGGTPKSLGAISAGEGPAYDGHGNLYFTGRSGLLRRDASGATQIFRAEGGPSGLLFDPQGRLLACEGRARRVTRTELDGSVTVLADQYEGHRFNSPNDLTIDSKGRIYFSDPRYGNRDSMEMKEEGVYRIDSPGKVTRILAGEVDRPNGVLVSPNDHYLFVADNNNNTAGGARKLWRFRLRPDGTIEPGSKHLLHDWETGRGPDGLKMDQQGRFYVAGGRNNPTKFETADKFKGGVYVLNQRGRLVGFIPIPTDEVTNCAFGGPDWKTLYITAGGTLWSIDLDARGWTPLSGLEK